MSAFSNVRKKTSNNRIFLSLNIFIYLFVASFIYFEVKIAFKETNTGIKYKKICSGKGISILDYIEKVKKENVDKKDDKGNLISKKVDNIRFLLNFERNITYKDKVVEYTNEDLRRAFIYDYEDLLENNYCGDYIECLNMLKNVGDTYLFKIKMKDLKNEVSVKNLDITDEDELCVELKLIEVLDSRSGYEIFMSHLQKIYKTYNHNIALEKELIMRYLNNIGRKYYVVGNYFVTLDDPGRGEYIKEGDIVKFNYSVCKHGYKIYDTTDEQIARKNDIYDEKKKYKPMEVIYKKGNDSYLDALNKFKKGSVGKIYYPCATFERNNKICFNEVFIDIISVTPGEIKKEYKDLKKEHIDIKAEPKDINKEHKDIKNEYKDIKKDNNVSTNNVISKKTEVNDNKSSNNVVNDKEKSNKNNVKNEENNKKNTVEKRKKVKEEDKTAKIFLGKKNKKAKKNKKNDKELTSGDIVQKAKDKRKKNTNKKRDEIKKNNEKKYN